jgi:hypothetical protein
LLPAEEALDAPGEAARRAPREVVAALAARPAEVAALPALAAVAVPYGLQGAGVEAPAARPAAAPHASPEEVAEE